MGVILRGHSVVGISADPRPEHTNP
jgi:hypothetical protein